MFVAMRRVRWRPVSALAVDAILAMGLGVIVFVGTHFSGMGQVPPRRAPDLVAYVLMATAAAALVGRRVWPLGTLAVTVAATAAFLALGYPYGPIFFTAGLALYTVGATLPLPRAAAASGVAVAAVLVPQLVGTAPTDLLAMLGHLATWQAWLLGLPLLAGVLVRFWRQSRDREREEAARRLAYEERLEVAREVHDVVGHGLAVINMQAGVALHVLERRPDQAVAALQAIKQTSKDALDDLRGTLAVVRRREPSSPLRPVPGLDQLDSLIAAMTESGLTVELVVAGDRVKLPAAVDLAAYRIVQESLTNVLRHAGSTPATVRVEYGAGEVQVEVTDRGRGPAAGAGDGRSGGHGIAGMRERAAAIGGSLEAGGRAGAGFRVLARLPLSGVGA
jgi:signal transduction histidine kinase